MHPDPPDDPEVVAETLLSTRSVGVRDVRCQGRCGGRSEEECAGSHHLVFTYRGVFARHLGRVTAVGEAGQVLLLNPDEGYRISHPVTGGDSCLSLALDPRLIEEMAAPELLRPGPTLAFRVQAHPLAPASQVLVAQLRRRLANGTIDRLEGECLALKLAEQAVGRPPSARVPSASARAKLAGRVKLLLASDPGRRWSLSEIAAEVGGSPVYLTQAFRLAEGLPLYRYQLQMRLARALELLDDYDDLSALAQDLGFSSHSHFTARFRSHFGEAPSDLRRTFHGGPHLGWRGEASSALQTKR